MKPRLKLMAVGAAAGAVLLLFFWLMGDVAHIFRMTLQDSSFFLGLVLSLFGVLIILRKGKYVAGGKEPPPEKALPQGEEEEPKVSKAPFLCLGAGLLNLLVCGLTFLF